MCRMAREEELDVLAERFNMPPGVEIEMYQDLINVARAGEVLDEGTVRTRTDEWVKRVGGLSIDEERNGQEGRRQFLETIKHQGIMDELPGISPERASCLMRAISEQKWQGMGKLAGHELAQEL